MKSMREARLPIAAMVVILMVLGGAMQGLRSAAALEIGFQTPQLRQTARVVALDERQHHEKRALSSIWNG